MIYRIRFTPGRTGFFAALSLLTGWAGEIVLSPEKPLMDLFPASSAPTFFEKQSQFVPQRQLEWWARDKKWHPELDERNVFHVTLQHRSVTERNWEISIGKGGQLYSIYSSFGEAMAPSTPGSQWNDEVWQFTTIYEPLLGNDLPSNPDDPTRMKFANAYVHQSGTYTKEEKGARAFYSPILGEHFDPEKRAFSILSWGQIPSPSINRSGVLVYAQYRDLGAGVIEVTYLIYNFEEEPMTNLSPWGGARTSVFPEHVISNPDGTYRFFTPFSYGFDELEGCRIHFEDTGGWGAMTANAADPNSYALGVVFGTDLDRKGLHYGKPRYDVGDSRHGTRDYTVQATVINIQDQPGTPHLLRMYFVIGTLSEVAEKANQLADFAEYEPLTFTEAETPRVRLYQKRIGGDLVLTRTPTPQPLCEVYAWPVNGSVPLFLMKNNQTGRHFMTTDPYAQCDREPFTNPFKPGDEHYEKYQNRTVYRPYSGQTDWIELLGFVLPQAKADTRAFKYTPFSKLLTEAHAFDAGDKLDAKHLMVRPLEK